MQLKQLLFIVQREGKINWPKLKLTSLFGLIDCGFYKIKSVKERLCLTVVFNTFSSPKNSKVVPFAVERDCGI